MKITQTTHTLPNGLRLVLADTHGPATCTALLLVGSGSRYENEKNNGIAHFFEHMAFKGSEKYPDAFAISSTIEGMGGVCNAFTSKDHTGYWIKGVVDKVPLMIDLLADMVTKPKLATDEIKKESGVIMEEINMYEDQPQAKVGNVYERLLYGEQPLGMDIIGTKETVSSFTRDTFTDYIRDLYYPANSVLVVSGGIGDEIGHIRAAVDSYFGRWENSHDASASFSPYRDSSAKGPRIIVHHKKTEQAHLIAGYRCFGYMHKDKYILSVLGSILGGGMSSRLFSELREKRGLCYYVSTGKEQYKETGSLATSAGVACDKNVINQAIELILFEHDKLTKDLVPDVELSRVKEMIKGRVLLSLEDSQSVAGFYGERLLLQDETLDAQDIIAKIDAVAADGVRDLAKSVFKKENLNIALIGPFNESDIII